jgi:small subunit ribosomal protein S4
MAKSDHKRHSSKHKIDRRLGVNLWGRPKSPVNSREYGPGQHGQRRKKPTDFGVQLMAKQKLKGYYGNIGEKQFKKYYAEAVRRRGDTGQNLVGILECRLDAILYRAKMVPTVFAARQTINHGHVMLNGKRCNIASVMLKPGDVISLKEKAKNIPAVLEAIASVERDVPEYVDADHTKFAATFVRVPSLDEVPYPVQMEPNLVVEYYSR